MGCLSLLQGIFPTQGSNPGLWHCGAGAWASLGAQRVNNLPTMPETWVQSLGWEDRLEKGMATHASILAWRILWTEEPGGLQSMGSSPWGCKRVGHDLATKQ